MAINFKSKPKPAPAPEAAEDPAPPAPKLGPKPSPKPPAKPAPSGLSFLKRGKEAQKIAAQEEAKAEMRSKDNIFRFWIPKDGEGDITFLDGDLTDGILDIPFYHEHNVYMNGSWMNWFICTQDEEPCPICEGGGNHAYVGIMTVIDHSEYTSKKDNTVRKDTIKLFVAKRDTIKLLQKQAVKRGGLRGCRFEVSRTGDKSPAVGSAFEFTEKLSDAELLKKYGAKNPKDQDRSKAVNYDEYLKGLYMPASELRKLGFGSAAAPVGSEGAPEGEAYDM